ncbi:MAG: hypothetical protein HRT74_05930 [Flavobacteriales bacterium]|nr:hypothetical protein [Flavobacteriales bacterium]
MRITRENYEAYVLDFIEGNLSEELQSSLMSFLEDNPDLNPDFDLEPVSLTNIPEDIVFEDKHALLRAPSGDSIEEQIIALIENDLSDNDKKELEDLLSRCAPLEKERAYFSIAKLSPEEVTFKWKEVLLDLEPTNDDLAWAAMYEGDTPGLTEENRPALSLIPEVIQFPNKAKLKKGGVLIALNSVAFRSAVGIAAAVLLVFLWSPWQQNSIGNSLAENNGINVELNSVQPSVEMVEDSQSSPIATSASSESGSKAPDYFQVTNTDANITLASTPVIPVKINRNAARLIDTEMPNKSISVHSVTELPEEDNTMIAAVEPISPPKSKKEVLTGAQFVGKKIRDRFNIQGPPTSRENLTALAQKAGDKIEERTNNKIRFEPPTTDSPKKKKWSLSLGKFSFRKS